MATTSIIQMQLYPLTTADGEAIPLDIIYPLWVASISFGASGVTSKTQSKAGVVASFYSREGCIIQFGDAPITPLANPFISGTEYDDSLLVLPDSIVVAQIPSSTWKIVPLSAAGSLIVQVFQKYANLALSRQTKFNGG